VISFASASAAGAAGYALTVLLTLTGLAAGACGLYLVGLALASFFARPTRGGEPRLAHQLAVLVPAHNEAALIARCLESLAGQDYPTDRYTVVVIADNCTDDTAAIAVACGVRVLTRESTARGKGQALQWAMEQLLNEADAPEAMVVIDADSVVDRGLLGGLTAELDRGAEVVQAEYLALTEDDSLRATLRASSLLLFHRVRFSGRKVLGLPCSLVGNGMLFSRQLLTAQPWTAYTSAEDLEFSVDLRLAGFRPVYASSALVRGPLPTRGRAASKQQLRWEGGRFHVVRTRLPGLVAAIVRDHRWSLIDAAIDLAVPPLGILALAAAAGTALSAATVVLGWTPAWVLVPWLIAFASVPTFVLAGFVSAGAPWATYRSLLLAPWFVMTGLVTRLRLLHDLRATTWERTERPGD
jgi:cellulose synthase/poly-beta-1,6-N-acetylglucosamine synthase-like glycosyltransferase